MNCTNKLVVIALAVCVCFGGDAAAQRASKTKTPVDTTKKQISTVDINRLKNEITITYADNTKEVMTEQQAQSRGLIHNGGYGNFKTVQSPPAMTNKLTVRNTEDSNPMYVLDGKEISKEEMNKIKPGDIGSVNVLKGKSATDKYGVKGKSGVVEITLKKEINEAIVNDSSILPDEYDGKKIHELIGATKTDDIISFRIRVQDNDENIQNANHEGNVFTATDRSIMAGRRKGSTITFDSILVKRNGQQIKLPAKLYKPE